MEHVNVINKELGRVDPEGGNPVYGALSRGFCCFKSILCWNHYFEALLISKMLLQSRDEDIKWILPERANHNEFLEHFLKT